MTTNRKRFRDYTTASTKLSAQQAEGIGVQEVGQEWQFLLNVRLSNTASRNGVDCTSNDSALLQHIETYIAKLERTLPRQQMLRSVYLHKLGDDYHAHIFSKYPLCVDKDVWDAELRTQWYALPLLQGANPDLDIAFEQKFKHTDSLEWGQYGIKGNNETTAWVLDLSVQHRNFNAAYKRGHRRLRRLGCTLRKLPQDFAAELSKRDGDLCTHKPHI